MRPDILIVGQGLAGTLLAWELERAGIAFTIADGGHVGAASAIAAGIINPITGRRLVKSWRYESLFPIARDSYRTLEAALGVAIWREMRVRRMFADEREQTLGADTRRREDLAEYIESADEDGWWVRGAARVDLANLLPAARARWEADGTLRSERIEIDREIDRYALVIDCRGREAALTTTQDRVPWEFSKGEILELSVDTLEQDVVLNRRMWVMPTGTRTALAGATHEPGVIDLRPSAAARVKIEEAARELLGDDRPFSINGHCVGVRVNLPDKRPVAGHLPENPRVGVLNGLGAKGALWAPMLAREWAEHLKSGERFDAEIDVRRFAVD
jgi:glycine/D-amino acid oxidase-like deaminating enzyme